MRSLSLDEFSACAAKFTARALTKIKTTPNIGGAAADLARSRAPEYGIEPCRPFASRRDPRSCALLDHLRSARSGIRAWDGPARSLRPCAGEICTRLAHRQYAIEASRVE